MVSIIVPVYNAEKFLEKCIASLIMQDYKDIEIILVDDGSNDNSVAICNRYCKMDSRVKLIRQDNSGVSVARNIGIRAARGEYIMFVDSDDFMESEAVSCVVEANTKIKADVVIFNYYKITSNQKIKCDSVNESLQTKEIFLTNSYSNLNTVYYYKIYNKLYKRKVIIENEIYFPETINMGEDFRFNLLYFSCCKYFLMLDNYLYNYRIDNEQSLMHTVDRLSVSNDIEEIYSTLNFFKDNLHNFNLCEKGLDRYILDKINGYVVLNYRTHSRKIKEISMYLKAVKKRYIIKDFSSVKFSCLMRLAWKFESGMILYIRQILIDKRYRMIIKIKGE